MFFMLFTKTKDKKFNCPWSLEINILKNIADTKLI